jgi:hypothetical protein
MTVVKEFLSAFFCAIIVFLTPIRNPMQALGLAFIADLLIGILTDIMVNHKKFDFKKFVRAVRVFCIYLLCIALLYTVGHYMGDENETLQAVKLVTYMFLYFIFKNTLKNLRQLIPHSEAIAFLDDMLGFEFAKRFSHYKKKEEEKDVQS